MVIFYFTVVNNEDVLGLQTENIIKILFYVEEKTEILLISINKESSFQAQRGESHSDGLSLHLGWWYECVYGGSPHKQTLLVLSLDRGEHKSEFNKNDNCDVVTYFDSSFRFPVFTYYCWLSHLFSANNNIQLYTHSGKEHYVKVYLDVMVGRIALPIQATLSKLETPVSATQPSSSLALRAELSLNSEFECAGHAFWELSTFQTKHDKRGNCPCSDASYNQDSD